MKSLTFKWNENDYISNFAIVDMIVKIRDIIEIEAITEKSIKINTKESFENLFKKAIKYGLENTISMNEYIINKFRKNCKNKDNNCTEIIESINAILAKAKRSDEKVDNFNTLAKDELKNNSVNFNLTAQDKVLQNSPNTLNYKTNILKYFNSLKFSELDTIKGKKSCPRCGFKYNKASNKIASLHKLISEGSEHGISNSRSTPTSCILCDTIALYSNTLLLPYIGTFLLIPIFKDFEEIGEYFEFYESIEHYQKDGNIYDFITKDEIKSYNVVNLKEKKTNSREYFLEIFLFLKTFPLLKVESIKPIEYMVIDKDSGKIVKKINLNSYFDIFTTKEKVKVLKIFTDSFSLGEHFTKIPYLNKFFHTKSLDSLVEFALALYKDRDSKVVKFYKKGFKYIDSKGKLILDYQTFLISIINLIEIMKFQQMPLKLKDTKWSTNKINLNLMNYQYYLKEFCDKSNINLKGTKMIYKEISELAMQVGKVLNDTLVFKLARVKNKTNFLDLLSEIYLKNFIEKNKHNSYIYDSKVEKLRNFIEHIRSEDNFSDDMKAFKTIAIASATNKR